MGRCKAVRARAGAGLATLVALVTLAGCGSSGGFAAESAHQILDTSLTAAAGARAVTVHGTASVLGQSVRLSILLDRRGAALHVVTAQRSARAVVFDGAQYGEASAAAGATAFGAQLTHAIHVGWIRDTTISPDLERFRSISVLFGTLSPPAHQSLKVIGHVTVDGQRAIRVRADGGIIDVALAAPHYPIDATQSQYGFSLTFGAWNAGRVTPPARVTTVAALQARATRVHTVTPHTATVSSTAQADGTQRFEAKGIDAQFDYPAGFVPLRLLRSKVAGSVTSRAEAAVGTGSDLGIVVSEFGPLNVPVSQANVALLAPAFDRAVNALAGRAVPVHIATIAGHPALVFGTFVSFGRTQQTYNVFAGTTMLDIRCQYSVAEQAEGRSACRQMLATLRVTGGH